MLGLIKIKKLLQKQIPRKGRNIPIVVTISSRDIIKGDFPVDPRESILIRISGVYGFSKSDIARDNSYGFKQVYHFYDGSLITKSFNAFWTISSIIQDCGANGTNLVVQTCDPAITASIIKVARVARLESVNTYRRHNWRFTTAMLDAFKPNV